MVVVTAVIIRQPYFGIQGSEGKKGGPEITPSLEEKPTVAQVADTGPFEVGPEGLTTESFLSMCG